MLLDNLISEEKKNNRSLYSSGPYWRYKNSKAIIEIKNKGLKNFRGFNSGVGTGYANNLVLDVRNELGWKGRIIAKLFSLPLLKQVFDQQIAYTKNHIDEYLKFMSIVFQNDENVKKLIRKYKFNNTTDFGCVKKFEYQNTEYSMLYLDIADRVEKISANLNFSKIKSFFEIGGGFGANIHFLITNFPNIKKVIYLDTVPNIYVGTEYLRHFYKDHVIDFLKTKNLKEIKFSPDDNLEIFCIPPWEIEKLKVNIDHFHNASSFVEMPKNIIKNYCNFIKSFNTKEISLISYGHFDEKTTFKPTDLNLFFENRLETVWQDWVIQKYGRKFIYLYSKKI